MLHICRIEHTQAMTNIKWTGKRGDYTAVSYGYILRAEMVSRGCWWYGCYFPNNGGFHNGHESSGKAAKQAAIEAMNEHMNKQ